MKKFCEAGILLGAAAVLVVVASGLLLHRTKDDREACYFDGDDCFGL